MRWIVLVFALCSNALAQDIEVLSGQAIGHGAVIHVAELEAKVSKLEAENESLRQQIRELTKGKEPTPAVVDDKPHLTIIGADDCPKCPNAKRLVKAWAAKVGYEYEEAKNHTRMRPGHSYPFFRLCWGDNCEEFDSTVIGLGDAIGSRLRKWGAKIDWKPVQIMPSQSTEYRTPRKTWGMHEGHVTPSVIGMTIEYHLTHEPHFIDITGMTVAEMEAKHQELHR